MRQLQPGVYDDDQGGLHVDLGELLRASGYADTPANRAELTRQFRAYCQDHGLPLWFDDDGPDASIAT